MTHPGTLELDLVNVHGEPLDDRVGLRLRHRLLSDEKRIDNVVADRTIRIHDLRVEPQGLYALEVRPRNYFAVSRFVTIRPGEATRITVPLPIDPDRVGHVAFPPYEELDARLTGVLARSARVRGHDGLSGHDLYEALDPVNRAGLLNIAAKSLVTPFAGGRDLLDHITLLDIRGDRCFAQVPGRLRQDVEHAGSGELFRAVPGGLHEPPPGFSRVGSFKTRDAYGNLQLTFFRQADEWVADVDIDDAAGLEHVFQVVRNSLRRAPTHPYCIHQILVGYQQLDPGYRLQPLES